MYRFNVNQEHYAKGFVEHGQKAGLREDDMDDIFAKLVLQIDKAIAEVRALAVDAGVPETTYEPILAGVKKRASLIE